MSLDARARAVLREHPSGVRDFDPVEFEILRNALQNVTEEMALVVRRAAYSTNIKTRADFSCAVFDADARCVATSSGNPGHLLTMCVQIPNAVRGYGRERFEPGDAILMNDPHRGSSHLNDITCISPIFAGGRLIGYVANLAHHVDVGGAAPASLKNNREIYQEGTILPPTRVVRAGAVDDNVFALLLANVRAPHETRGDLRAQFSANAVGTRRVVELAGRYSSERLAIFCEQLIRYTARWTEAEIRKLPEGVYRAQGFMDDDGFSDEPVPIAVTVTIRDGAVTLDAATGSAPQTRSSINCTPYMSRNAIMYVVRALINQDDLPLNVGFIERIRTEGPLGTVCTARPPSAVAGAFETVTRLTELIWKALHPALPDRVPASGKGLIVNLGFGGRDPRRDVFFCYMETVAGGNGARPTKDGPDAVQTNFQNTENAPVEEVELNYPMRIACFELIPDSCGAGRYRGGVGVRRDYEFPDADCVFTVLSDGRKFPPHGLGGGQPARTAHFVLDPETDPKELPSKVTITVEKGGRVSVQTPGGGGFGDPAERDAEAVRRDLRDGKITASYARRWHPHAL